MGNKMQPRSICAGKFVLKSIIGKGGMGVVYLGYDTSLERHVAIKLLHPTLTENEHFKERFHYEAIAMARLNHPNIVTVHDKIEIDEENLYGIVMEVVDGKDLRSVIDERKGALNLKEALNISTQVLTALNTAHQQGIIHRDVKPNNIMITNNNQVKVMDFGIAMLLGAKRLTACGDAFGTPHYMSPEQIMTPLDIDHRTDVYSFGIVMFEMLTGNLPFDSDSEYLIKNAHIETMPPKLTDLNNQLPLWLNDVMWKALAKDRDDRFVGCGEYLEFIENKYHNQVKESEPKDSRSKFIDESLPVGRVCSICFQVLAFENSICDFDGGSMENASPINSIDVLKCIKCKKRFSNMINYCPDDGSKLQKLS